MAKMEGDSSLQGIVGLTQQEQRLLRFAKRAPWQIAIGFALATLGGLYGYWGLQQIDPSRPVEIETAFDRPIARIARLTGPRREQLDRLNPTTELEHRLIADLKLQSNLTTRLMLGLLRFLFASMQITGGLIFMTAGLDQLLFLRIVHKIHKGRAS